MRMLTNYYAYVVNIHYPWATPITLSNEIKQKSNNYAVELDRVLNNKTKRITILRFKALSPEEAHNFRRAANRIVKRYKRRFGIK